MQHRELARILEYASLLLAGAGASGACMGIFGHRLHIPPIIIWAAAMGGILFVCVPAMKWASDTVLPTRIGPRDPFDEGGLSSAELSKLTMQSPRIYKVLAAFGLASGVAAAILTKGHEIGISDETSSSELFAIGAAVFCFSLLALPIHGSISRSRTNAA